MTTVNSIFPGGLPYGLYKSLNTSTDPELQAVLAASTLLAQPEVLEPVAKAATQVLKAVASNPQEAAELARKASEAIFPLIKGINRVSSVDDGVSSVTETTKTTRREKTPTGTKTVTTTTTTTEKTVDREKQQKRLEHDLNTTQVLINGLGEGKIQVGDEAITFDQVEQLVEQLTQFVALVEKQNLNKAAYETPESVIDIGEDKTSAAGNTTATNLEPPTSPKLDLGAIGELVGGEGGLFTLLSTLKPETLDAIATIVEKVKAAKGTVAKA